MHGEVREAVGTMAGWNAATLARGGGEGAITVIEGSSFCISDADGDIDATRPHGLFVHDLRLISSWTTRVNGMPLQALSSIIQQPHRVTILARASTMGSSSAESSLVVERERTVGVGIREKLTLTNFSPVEVDASLEMTVEADFADIFEVKESRVQVTPQPTCAADDGCIAFEAPDDPESRGVIVRAHGATTKGNRIEYRARIRSHESWTTSISIVPTTQGCEAYASFAEVQPPHEEATDRRHVAWHSDIPNPILENDAIEVAIRRGQTDIGSLRIFDGRHPERLVVAAGAPWFMALFGRDSILTSLMTLPVDPSLALGTLRTLGDRQGVESNPLTEEQPGRILHEVRLGTRANLALGGKDTYFGTVDATPLYVVAVGELSRWGIGPEALADLVAHSDRALRWITEYGDRDGDGFVEYERSSPEGLANQGWKDSWDAIAYADGTMAAPPIALCEVQGYVYAAYLARAELARQAGDDALAHSWEGRAASVKKEFNDRFWLPEHNYFAIALDRDKRPVDACASNMGHCLWSGIVDDDKAPFVAERLMSPEMFSGWGVRTLASNMANYNPVSYHNGTVWPHDNALIAAGLMRYGFEDEAHRVALAIFEAAACFDGRLPELFCGFSRDEYPTPVAYPNACLPQAWAAATPFALMSTLLRLDVMVPSREIWLAPSFPQGFGHVRVENLPIAGARVTVDVNRGRTVASGVPKGFTVRKHPRYGTG